MFIHWLRLTTRVLPFFSSEGDVQPLLLQQLHTCLHDVFVGVL